MRCVQSGQEKDNQIGSWVRRVGESSVRQVERTCCGQALGTKVRCEVALRKTTK